MTETTAKNVFGWDYFFVYLSGPIDFAIDKGSPWRDDWINKLIEIGFKKEQILNPCKKPLKHAPFNLDNEQEIMNKYKKNREWSKLMDSVNQIMHIDLRLVDLSSLVCANFPKIGRKSLEEDILKWEKTIDIIDNFISSSDKNAFIKERRELEELFTSVVDRYSEQRVPTYGTMHEIVVARQQKNQRLLCGKEIKPPVVDGL